jgi:site-specific DNA-methyltransferase (adenine-specific)
VNPLLTEFRHPSQSRNPDVLSCIANLSSDEVFTSPSLANQMLDILEQSWSTANQGANIWKNSNIKFLDPFTKSGVFLREITKRLILGLEGEFPNLQDRVNHILNNQVFGIAITQITALLARRSVYCSKDASGIHSIVNTFDNHTGKIVYIPTKHTWKNGKCSFCGAWRKDYDRAPHLESHAYSFIHADNIKNLTKKAYGENMQFDVIIGNPPYQMSDGGHGRSAKPVYHLFVEQALALNPSYLLMVIPARWYAGGKGLDDFRHKMLNDKHLRHIEDFENASDVFPGVDIAGGVCFFMRSQSTPDENNMCTIANNAGRERIVSTRPTNEFDILIRQAQAIPIIRKIMEAENMGANGVGSLSNIISPRKPFGIPGNYVPKHQVDNGVPCHFTQGRGLGYALESDLSGPLLPVLRYKWKLLIPRAPIAGQTDFSKPIMLYYEGNIIIAKPGEVCSETWLVAYSADSEEEVKSFQSYLLTKTVRFLLLQRVISQDVPRERFAFIPHLGTYDISFTDEVLRERWGITDTEWNYIDSKIRNHGD